MAEHALITRLPHFPNDLIYAALYQDVQNSALLRQQLIDCNAEFEYAFIDASTILSTKHILAACFRAINDAAHSRLRSRNVHSEIVFALNPSNNIAESFRRFGVQDTTTSLLAIKVIHTSSPSSPPPSLPQASQQPPLPSPSQTQTQQRHLQEQQEQEQQPSDAAIVSSIAAHLTKNVQGTAIPLTDEHILEVASDIERIRKIYKVPAPPSQSSAGSRNPRPVVGAGAGVGAVEGAGLEKLHLNGTSKLSPPQVVELEAVLLGSMAIRGS